MYKIFGEVAGKLVFDCGANVGDYTKYFTDRGAKVVSIEPQINLTKDNSNFDRAEVLNICLSDKEGEITLYECGPHHTIASCSPRWKDEGRFKDWGWDTGRVIQATTLDNLITKYGQPDIIKIDVEGHEHSVIRGLSFKPRMLSFEYVHEFKKEAIDCIESLYKLGFRKAWALPMCKEANTINFNLDKDPMSRLCDFIVGIAHGDMGDIIVE